MRASRTVSSTWRTVLEDKCSLGLDGLASTTVTHL